MFWPGELHGLYSPWVAKRQKQLSDFYFLSHLLYPFIADGHLGCFYILAIVNSATMNIEVHVSFQIVILSRYMLKSGIAGLYGNSIFSFLMNLHTNFHSSVQSLYFSNFSPSSFHKSLLVWVTFSLEYSFQPLFPSSCPPSVPLLHEASGLSWTCPGSISRSWGFYLNDLHL